MMYLPIVFAQEARNYLVSRRFLFSLLLIFLPALCGIWFSHMMYHDPSIVSRMTGGWITQVTPKVCLMVYMDIAPLPVALAAIINASDFIAGEHKRGMLQLLVAKPINRGAIVLGKYFSFLVLFLLIVFLKLALFNFALGLLQIGWLEYGTFLSYFLALALISIIYASIATLFSACMDNVLAAILGGFLLLIAWYIFDWMIMYLPSSVSDVLELFSLSYYVNRVIYYLSDGAASLFLGGTPPSLRPSVFLNSLAIVLALGAIPVVASIVVLQRKDIV